jgi:5-methylcytosine-specific restriction endonuclease McrA
MRRYFHRNGSDGYISYAELVSLSRVYLMTGFVCWYCGKKMGIGEGSMYSHDCCTIEHKVAFVNGGENTIENVVLCCLECNTKKGVIENHENQTRNKE